MNKVVPGGGRKFRTFPFYSNLPGGSGSENIFNFCSRLGDLKWKMLTRTADGMLFFYIYLLRFIIGDLPVDPVMPGMLRSLLYTGCQSSGHRERKPGRVPSYLFGDFDCRCVNDPSLKRRRTLAIVSYL